MICNSTYQCVKIRKNIIAEKLQVIIPTVILEVIIMENTFVDSYMQLWILLPWNNHTVARYTMHTTCLVFNYTFTSTVFQERGNIVANFKGFCVWLPIGLLLYLSPMSYIFVFVQVSSSWVVYSPFFLMHSKMPTYIYICILLLQILRILVYQTM